MAQKPISLTHWGAFEATVEDGRLTRATPVEGSGASAEMIGAIPEMVYSDQRILRPHIRKGWLERKDRSGRGSDEMIAVDWDTALDAAASEIARVRDSYGHKALFAGSYGWSSAGRFHHARTQIRRFYDALGGFTDQTGNYSWGAAEIILKEVLGSAEAVSGAATSWDSICGNTDTFVAFGGLNPKNWNVTSGGAGHHHMPDHVRRAEANGTKFVVLSPVADDIPEGLSADWVALRPGSDTAVMLALTQEMIRRGRADRAFLDRYTSGADRLFAYLDGTRDGTEKSLAWAAAIADVPLDQLTSLADRIETGRVMLTAAWALQRAVHGEMTFWALIALASVLGQIGQPGGGFSFGYGSLNAVGHGATKGLVPAMERLGNTGGTTIPVARFADMMDTPGKEISFAGGKVTLPDVRLIHWAGGNPFHHAQDLFRLDRLWRKPDTVIVNEQFWTPTAKRADIVFPATTSAERCDIGGTSRDRHVFYMPKLIDPCGEARSDFDIFSQLAVRLDAQDRFTEGLDEQGWLRRLWVKSEAKAKAMGLEAPDYDGLRTMNVWHVPTPDQPEVLLGGYRADPLAQPLDTPSGRIELSSDRIARYGLADMPPHPTWTPHPFWVGDKPAGQFALLSRQPAQFLHSQLAQTSLSTSPDVMMNPQDAQTLGLADGDVVTVSSEQGSCRAVLRVSPQCRRQVVAMATGPWFAGRDGHDPSGNPNALTPDVPTSTLSQATAAQSCIVEINPETS